MLSRRSVTLSIASILLAAVGLAQTGLEDEGLRSLIDGPGGEQALIGGNRAVYVKNQAKTIPAHVLYDHPNGLQSRLVHTSGKTYSAKARYVRETGEVEFWYGGRAYRADGDAFPYVQIGDNVYAYNDYGTSGKPALRYGKLVAGSSETDYQILRSYVLTRKSNMPSSNAFSQAEPDTYRIDSTDVMIGDRPFAQEIAKRRRFANSLTPCAAGAHERALRRARFRTQSYYDALVDALQADCRRAEDEAGH